jgi:hypothetical protein
MKPAMVAAIAVAPVAAAVIQSVTLGCSIMMLHYSISFGSKSAGNACAIAGNYAPF